MKVKTDKFVETAERELKNEYARGFLALVPPFLSILRDEGLKTFEKPEIAGKYGAEIKRDAINRLPELLKEFEENASKNGAEIFWAKDASSANNFILDLIKKNKITKIAKGKSMVTEEIGLNETLNKEGIEILETDLGELIIQMLERPPFHIVGPAINIPVNEISDIFMKKGLLEEPETDPVKLGKAARKFLREKFRNLEMGVTGINFAVAKDGTIINVENEGNIRFVKSSPKIQVSIMTIEKVVPKLEDALYLLRLLTRNATGQKITSYVSMDSGPKKKNEIDGPEELYIIILDNGRSEKFNDPNVREAFQCIRCGACQNVCPVFSKIGGYSYGWAYGGPIGQVLNPLLLGLNVTIDLYRACTSCGRCSEICPGGLNHSEIFRYFRSLDVKGDLEYSSQKRPLTESIFFNLFGYSVTDRKRWNRGINILRPFFNSCADNGNFSTFIKPVEKWKRGRNLDPIQKKTFNGMWKELKKEL